MAQFENLGLRAGVWHGTLEGAAPARIYVSLLGQPAAEAALTPAGANRWSVAAPLPPEFLNDGVHTLLMMAEGGGGAAVQLGKISVMAGEVLAEDLGAEIALLRAEVDMLKSELRRLARQPATDGAG